MLRKTEYESLRKKKICNFYELRKTLLKRALSGRNAVQLSICGLRCDGKVVQKEKVTFKGAPGKGGLKVTNMISLSERT